MPGFQAGLMGDAYRPSENMEVGRPDDALVRFLLRAEAYMPDELRQQQGRAPLTHQQRAAAFAQYNNRLPYMDPNNDPFGLGREEPLGPGRLTGVTPEMMQALTAGPGMALPSFRQLSDDSLSDQEFSRLLAGQGPAEDPASAAISAAIARLSGRLTP